MAEETRHGDAVQAREGGGPDALLERAQTGLAPLSPRGWASAYPLQATGSIKPKGAIGVVIAQKFPDPEIIRVKLEEGFQRVSAETVWVMRDAERKGHAANYAWQTFRSHGIVPFLAPLVPSWKSKGVERDDEIVGAYDLRAAWRDSEMRSTCERIIVFHDVSSNVTADWVDYCADRKKNPSDGSHCLAKIFVIERGKKPIKRYKQGKAMS